MSNALIGEPYYNRHMPWIDSIGFAATGCIALAQLRAFEWIPFPLSHTEIALAGIVNGLTSTLSYRLGKGDEASSPYRKVALTVLGIGLGVILFPFVTLKLLKSRASLIIPGPILRVAFFHLVTKFFLEQACHIGEKCYEKLNFPIFQDFENMPPHDVGVFYQHYKEHPEAWKKQSFKKQLGFNRALLKHNLHPLEMTSVDLTTTLTTTELGIVKELYKDKALSQEQKTLLYNFDVAPKDHNHQSEILPDIDPINAQVHQLSDEQISWHHRWLIQHYSDLVSQTQVEAFAQKFYQLDLPPPHPDFIAEIPFSHPNHVTSKAKALYHYGFYKTHPDAWDNLKLLDQIYRREFLDNYHFEPFTLTEPLLEEIPFIPTTYIQELKNYFEAQHEAWNEKSYTYQAQFKKALDQHQIAPMYIPKKAWSKTDIAITVMKYSAWSVATYVVLQGLYYAKQHVDKDIEAKKLRLEELKNLNIFDNNSDSGTTNTCIGTQCKATARNVSSYIINSNSTSNPLPPELQKIYVDPQFCATQERADHSWCHAEALQSSLMELSNHDSIYLPCFPEDTPFSPQNLPTTPNLDEPVCLLNEDPALLKSQEFDSSVDQVCLPEEYLALQKLEEIGSSTSQNASPDEDSKTEEEIRELESGIHYDNWLGWGITGLITAVMLGRRVHNPLGP